MDDDTPIRWRLIFAAWTIPAVLGAVQSAATTDPGDEHAWSRMIAVGAFWYAWALVTPLIFALARRVPIAARPRWRVVAVHVSAGVAIAVVLSAWLTFLDRWLTEEGPWTAAVVLGEFTRFLTVSSPGFILIYGVLIALGTGLDMRRRYRAGLLRTSQLEARYAQLERRLAESRLEALRMQLQPHFLFNTLHAISALMDEDVPAARAMTARLSELLRLVLAVDGRQETPLGEEIDLLERYLDIERIRLGERLRLSYAVDDDTLEVPVPSLVLQPLVENAIRYGVAPRADGGEIEIAARLDGDRLRLTVTDDGPGMNGNEEGIGLANTRARLEELYGDAGRLDLQNGAGRGLTVVVAVPVTGDEESVAGDEDDGEDPRPDR